MVFLDPAKKHRFLAGFVLFKVLFFGDFTSIFRKFLTWILGVFRQKSPFGRFLPNHKNEGFTLIFVGFSDPRFTEVSEVMGSWRQLLQGI